MPGRRTAGLFVVSNTAPQWSALARKRILRRKVASAAYAAAWVADVRRMSSTENLDSGNPGRCGNSQARALTWTTRLGGKAGCPPTSGLTLEAREAGQSESLPPLADDLTRRIEAGGDQIIGKAIGCHENNPGTDNVTIR
jgi:hypothetical protein